MWIDRYMDKMSDSISKVRNVDNKYLDGQIDRQICRQINLEDKYVGNQIYGQLDI